MSVAREHARYLRDRARLDAFARALAEVVEPGHVVVDYGAGTGVLGMLACRAGAGHVYAVEADPIASLARRIVRINGFGDRTTVIRERAAHLTLPERADVVVGDLIGLFGVDDGVIALWRDARARLLAPGGALIPRALDVVIAPVENARLARRIHGWRRGSAGFDVEPLGRMIVNSIHPAWLRPSDLLAEPAVACAADLTADVPMPLRGRASFTIARDGVLHGIGAWFTAQLSPSVTMTNAPGVPHRIRRPAACLPVAEPVTVRAGETVTVALRLRPSAPIYAWDATVSSGTCARVAFHQSTLEAAPIDPADLRRPDSRPVLSPYGEARAAVLRLCDGQSTVQEIECLVYDRHRALFGTPAEAGAFVAGVLARHARREG